MARNKQNKENAMSTEQERDTGLPPTPPRDDKPHESLTDLMDRMDREAFHRALEQRHMRIRAYQLQRHPT
jgi:hypothetical protein